MGRQTKKEQERCAGIEKLSIIKRDNPLYTQFEASAKHNGLEKHKPYSFVFECKIRASFESLHDKYMYECSLRDPYSKLNNGDIHLGNMEDMAEENIVKDFKKLDKIDKKSFLYLFLIHTNILYPNTNTPQGLSNFTDPYYIKNIIGLDVLEQWLGKDRAEELNSSNLDQIIDKLSSEEKDRLLKCLEVYQSTAEPIRPFYTYIYDQHKNNIATNGIYSRSLFVDLDLSKPTSEIVDYVKMLKKDFDENQDKFRNVYDLLRGDIEKKFEIDLQKSHLYTIKHYKPLGGKLADILFIYDCNRVGLTHRYMRDEIDRYWNRIKELKNDNLTEKTLLKYLDFSKDQIDNKKYEEFLSGGERSLNKKNNNEIIYEESDFEEVDLDIDFEDVEDYLDN